MKGNKALKRAIETKDAIRINNNIPLIRDTTELITPQIAEKMLQKNKSNRPINWNKVEEYAQLMRDGKWEFHSQGIILDNDENILTGQKRLWAIIYSGTSQYMRVSRGTPFSKAKFIDRGTPQSSRDLAARETERKHSPMEASIVRAMCALKGNARPSTDKIAEGMVKNSNILSIALKETKGIKKTKAIYMILGAICSISLVAENRELFGVVEELSEELDNKLSPTNANQCWNKGAAFILAMEKAVQVIKNINKT